MLATSQWFITVSSTPFLTRHTMTSLTRFQTEDGIELVIDTQTGESFTTEAGYVRMSNKPKTTVASRVQKGVRDGIVKTSEIVTARGLQGVRLIPASLVFKWAIRDNPELAEKMGECGTTVFLHQLAGYQVNSTAVGQHPKTPQTYIEALKALVAAEEEKELLRIENAQLEEETERLSEVVDELFDYSSIVRIAKYNKCSENLFNWRKLKSASAAKGLEVKKVPCPRFETKNLYHHDAWRYMYPDVKLPETTRLVMQLDLYRKPPLNTVAFVCGLVSVGELVISARICCSQSPSSPAPTPHHRTNCNQLLAYRLDGCTARSLVS